MFFDDVKMIFLSKFSANYLLKGELAIEFSSLGNFGNFFRFQSFLQFFLVVCFVLGSMIGKGQEKHEDPINGRDVSEVSPKEI